MNPELLQRLASPETRMPLTLRGDGALMCEASGATFPVIDDIPQLLPVRSHAFDRNDAPIADYRAHYETDAEEFDYFEERTGATEHDERRVHEYILSMMPRTARSVLDVGCGRAWIAAACLPRGMFVCSMDISARNPREALRRFPSPNHAGVVADVFAPPFRDGAFDCVVASEIIEHVVDPPALVRELLRVVAPGGALIVTTPYKEVIKMGLCIHCNKPTPINAHLHSFDEQKLGAMAPTGDAVTWRTFGNKALIYLRTYIALRVLPFALWELTDRIANAAVDAPAHILVRYDKH